METPDTRIFKYTVPLMPGEYTLESKHALTLLSAAEQHGQIAIWAIADTSTKNCNTVVQILFTGMEVKVGLKWLATFTDTDGLVYHVFEKL